MSSSNKLFHYTTYNTAIEHILDTGLLRFSPLQSVNDPRESLDWLCSLKVNSETTLPIDFGLHESINQDINNHLKKNTKILCLSQSATPPKDVENLHLDFYEGYARSRMWAQYAGNHTGICLAFDRQELTHLFYSSMSKHGSTYDGEVNYSNTFPSLKNFSFDYDDYTKRGAKKNRLRDDRKA